MIAVILNLAILTFLQHGTTIYQQPGINCYRNLTHTNSPYQNIKQNGGHLKRILRVTPQSDDYLRDITIHVENELEGINPETLALYPPLLPEYSFSINEISPQENLPQNNTTIDSNETTLINLLTDFANAHANNNNNNALNNENSNTTLPPSANHDFVMERLNLIYRMDELWESVINDMFSQYNNFSDAFELTPEARLVIWNQSWRPHLEYLLNTAVLAFENYNMSTPEVEANVLDIIERAKIEFQIFIDSTRIAYEALNNSNNTDQSSQTEV
ncbi:Plasmodium exported protein, unknown function [Plasmodium berghei]|uniref:Plasmodium RESA N-terminal domain-containing protein n=2 Tax=Plasmodium berghei TaxID=5821 RepID=A0A509AHR4_PLABA|nr:Plasmodium exported protein, unknown function [Plasmodium berghei ANKA]CXI21001.1 Plasmodium exported protein, unknown function [Plasmodium berghei]SBW38158.1 Plasmodium exported protein, unknown function [Plasmodium berghei]SCL81872.1 Plasmodium exported protein, unknown function [Plasmodium berghei]SCL82214.1 Plasmodium exported protein, unknown function [Plasmodium berghei]SCL82473.1 Plasmodium exported protein, unknown function [Plasmodium berghei]|eukprot:XP_034420730.1 Plasmodium exported protein, unknown function [Plasmodium berghei ANKA]